MLVWVDEAKKITAWNEMISIDEAKQYLSDKCIWVENLKIIPPSVAENQIVQSYLNDDMSIRYKVVNVFMELTEQEQTALETSVNIDYLVCLADMGLIGGE